MTSLQLVTLSILFAFSMHLFDGDHSVSYFSGIDSDLALALPVVVFADSFEQ